MNVSILPVAILAAASIARAQTPSTPATTDSSSKPKPYFEFQVERQATPRPSSVAPVYPPELRAKGVEGMVLAQFVVGTDGRADMRTFKVLRSSHEQFTRAVYDAVKAMQFQPARIDGAVVKQVVQQPFVFSLPKRDTSAPAPRP